MPGYRVWRILRNLPVILLIGAAWATPALAAVKKPDVVPTSLSVASGSSTLTPGTTTPLQVAISNRGAATAYSVTLTISLVANGTTSQISKASVGTLPPGASGTVATTFPVPTQLGTYDVIATASAWRDANRENNSLTKRIQVATSSTTTTPTSGTSTPTTSPPAAAPTLSALTPSSATAGGTAFTLVVDGSNFSSGATVLWNGAARTTTVVDTTRVTASIPGSDLGAAGSATVTVRNGDTQVSNALSFTVKPAPTTTACTTGQFFAQYFANTSLTAPATRTACESSINYDWGTGGAAGLPVDAFSVRWTGRFSFAAGSYTFTARADDGIRVFVDGVQVINAWVVQAPTTYTATHTLTAGEHEVKVEYFENYSIAVAQVAWAPTPAPSTTTATSTTSSTTNTALKYKTYLDGRLAANASSFDSAARSGDINTYMGMNYIIDGVTGMYEGTGDASYLVKALQWAEWEIATATVRDSGGYLNWRGPWASPYSSTPIAYQYQELDVARNLMRVARDILVNPSLRTTYGTRAQAVHDFLKRNVADKWFSASGRNCSTWLLSNATIDPIISDKVAYAGMLLLDMVKIDPSLAYASLLDGLITGTTARLKSWGSSGALWINAGTTTGDAGNTSHAGLFVHFLTRAHEDGRGVSLAQVQGIAKLMTAVIWNRSTSDPMFTNYTDGSNGSYAGYGPYGYGVIFAGWHTLPTLDTTAGTATAAVLDGIIAGTSNPSLDRMDSIYGQVVLAGYLTRAGW